MGYYVDLDVDEMADELWANYRPATGNNAAVGNTFGNNRPKSAEKRRKPRKRNCLRGFHLGKGE